MMNRRHREDVLVRRHVTVETIPSGHPVELEPGQLAQITQALGGSFTLLVEGQRLPEQRRNFRRRHEIAAFGAGAELPAAAAVVAEAGAMQGQLHVASE